MGARRRATSRSSWTATAAGPNSKDLNEREATRPANGLCSTSSKGRSRPAFATYRCMRSQPRTGTGPPRKWSTSSGSTGTSFASAGRNLLVCFNYGGRAELEDAARAGSIAENLYAPDVPDVDLLIRTSGERRLSNFLLWQSAYAEFYFTDLLWPDFDRKALFTALDNYAARERRFGGLR